MPLEPTHGSPLHKVAVVQASSVFFDLDRSFAKVTHLTAEAASQGAELVLFPEAFLSGYPRDFNFGAVIGSRTEAGREQFRLYWESSVDVPGPFVDRLGKLAQKHKIILVIGVVERDGGTLYCTVLFFANDGTFLGKHRKIMPTASERLVWGFGDGSTLPVFDTSVGKVGAVICWENYLPLMRAAMYSKGIQIYCAPTADARDSWLATVRHIAVEGRCFVLSANQFATTRDVPSDSSAEPALSSAPKGSSSSDHSSKSNPASARVLSDGGSCIVDPFGNFLAGPDRQGEAILTAELDLRQIIKGKFDLDVVGHYARPDIFQLQVDTRKKTPVKWNDSDSSASCWP